MKQYHQAFEEINGYISQLAIVDTHEHLEPPAVRFGKKADLFNVFFNQYIINDLVSSGMSFATLEQLTDEATPLEDKWKLLRPYLAYVRNTGYYKVILRVFQDFYGIPELNDDTYTEINRKMLEENRPGLYEQVLQKRSGITACIWDNLFAEHEFPASYIKRVFRVCDFIVLTEREKLGRFEQAYGRPLETLEAYFRFIGGQIEDAKRRGYMGLKNTIAYGRCLNFDLFDPARTEKNYRRLYRREALTSDEILELGNHIMHEIVKAAIANDLPMQIHTGLHAGDGNFMMNSNPAHLAGLFLKYPEARFSILHGGYPYGGEFGTMGKSFPNVFLDMSWLHAISPLAAQDSLDKWLDLVPVNKIFGFGGDYISVELVYGHSKIARENIASVLSKKVEQGDMTISQAKSAADRILYGNPAAFFGVEPSAQRG